MERRTLDELAEEALTLPNEDRALLVERLVESLDPTDNADLQAVWGAEAMRRLDDVREGRVQAIPMEEALKRVRQAVGRRRKSSHTSTTISRLICRRLRRLVKK